MMGLNILSMFHKPLINRRRSVAGTLFLVTALLFAQWLGLAHRIDHSDLQQMIGQAQGGLVTSQSDVNVDKSLDHSCALFDGAALATALNSPAIVPAICLLRKYWRYGRPSRPGMLPSFVTFLRAHHLPFDFPRLAVLS